MNRRAFLRFAGLTVGAALLPWRRTAPPEPVAALPVAPSVVAQAPAAAESTGGYLVPDMVADEIRAILKSHGVARKLVRVVPMKGKRLTLEDVARLRGVAL